MHFLLQSHHFSLCMATKDAVIVMTYSEANVLCLQPQRYPMHAYTNITLCVCVCECVCAYVCMCVCMCTRMYVCGNYYTQNVMELIGGSLYFNYLPSFTNWFVQYTPCFTDGYFMVDDSCGNLSVIDNSLTLQ